eukprot:1156487-Pelagomonas_calceolata.AAC.3
MLLTDWDHRTPAAPLRSKGLPKEPCYACFLTFKRLFRVFCACVCGLAPHSIDLALPTHHTSCALQQVQAVSL